MSPTNVSPSRIRTFLGIARRALHLSRNTLYDYARFSRYSLAVKKSASARNLEALITMDYHRLEKGMSLKAPRPGFGLEVANKLIANLKRYLRTNAVDHELLQVVFNVLSEYTLKNQVDDPRFALLNAEILSLTKNVIGVSPNPCGGTTVMARDDVLSAVSGVGEKFFRSRFSVRDFGTEAVDSDRIRAAVLIAQKTPSVCNRQAWGVYSVDSVDDKRRVLELQNGNRGFGESASRLLVVVGDLRGFVSIGERNQMWIDGGMFAMSLVYGLHSVGLASCCLNWSVEYETDKKMRKLMNLPSHEVIVMLIAVGTYPESFKVAQSYRPAVEKVLRPARLSQV